MVLDDQLGVRRLLVLGDDRIRVVLFGGLLGDDRGDLLGNLLLGGDRLDLLVDGLDLLGLGGGGLGCCEQLGLPGRQRLDLATLFGLLVALDEALGGSIRDDAGQQADRADGVVVTRDRVLNLVGVAVGVEDRDDRDAQLVRLVDGEVLLLGVDDPDRPTASS